MAKRNKERLPETFTGTYSAIPHRVLDSVAFKGSSDRAKSLLFALLRQINGKNNGRLQLTEKWLKSQGWPSKKLNAEARKELTARGLVIQTRRGGLNSGCHWYAVTWLKISNFTELDISSANYHQGAWAECTLPPSVRRKPPLQKRKTSPHTEPSTTLIRTPETASTTLIRTPETAFFSDPTTLIRNPNVFNTSSTNTEVNSIAVLSEGGDE